MSHHNCKVQRKLKGFFSTRAREHSLIAKKIWLSIYPRNLGSHVSVRPSDRPSASQGNQCKTSQFLASVGACNLVLHVHVVVN